MNKSHKTHSGWNWKILRMAFLKNSKAQKLPQKHPQNKTSKIQKLIEGGLKSEKFRKQIVVRIEKY